jgi:hypothetical protein
VLDPLAYTEANFESHLTRILTSQQKKNLSVVGMGWGLAFVLILIHAWER